jgi:hypothetical protein
MIETVTVSRVSSVKTKAGGIEIRSLLERQSYNLEKIHITTATLIKFAQKIVY